MNAAILANKLIVPFDNDLIHRQALCEQLQSQSESPLIVLQAPAGFGKTSLVCDWIQYSDQTAAWYSLDHADNIPTTFWLYMCEAFSHIHPSISEEAKLFLSNQSIDNLIPICDSVINGLNKFTRNRLRPNKCILVLDDFHLIHNQDIVESISRLIDYKPYWLQIVITSRTLPDLRIPKRISKQQAILITNQDLTFDKTTCSEIFIQQSNHEPTEEILNYIFEQTDGWPAAVQLLIRFNDMSGKNNVLPAIEQDLIADYLMEEVFLNLDENTRELLNVICIFPRFNLSIINQIVDSPISRFDFDKLISSGILVTSIQDQANESFYKIHDLFRDWLESNLNSNNSNLAKDIRSKAIHQLLKINAFSDALTLALKNEAWPLASNILGQFIFNDYQSSHLDYIQFQLNQFPEEQFNSLPILSVLKVNLLFNQHKQNEMNLYLEKGDKVLNSIQNKLDDNTINSEELERYGLKNVDEFYIVKTTLILLQDLGHLHNGEFSKLKTIVGEFTLSEQHPLHFWLDYIRLAHATMEENFEDAIQIGYRALKSTKENKNANFTIVSACWLSQALFHSGQVKAAFRVLNETRDLIIQINALNSPNMYVLYSLLGFLYIENLEFKKAYEMYCLVENNISNFTDPRAILYNKYHFKLRLLVSTHQFEEAGKWLQETYKYEEAHIRGLNQSTFMCQPDTIIWDILYQLKLGNTMPIIQWAMNYEAPEYSAALKQSVETWIQAIGLMFCGQDQTDVFEKLLQDAIHNNNKARQVGLNFLKATLWFHQGQIEKSDALIINTIKFAKDCQYKQLVLDANPYILNKLHELQDHAEIGNYCQFLLQANKEKSSINFEVDTDSNNDEKNITINSELIAQLEQLTRREAEILQLLAKGMRNQEIADDLNISLPTVKRHIQNVYAKLNINSRTEAALIYTQAQHS